MTGPEAVALALNVLRAEQAKTQAAIAGLEQWLDDRGPVAAIAASKPLRALPAPKRAKRGREAKAKPSGEGRRLGAHDDEIKRLWLAEAPIKEIEKKTGLSGAGIRYVARKLALPERDRKGKLLGGGAAKPSSPAPAAPIAPASQPKPMGAEEGLDLKGILRFLKAIGHVVYGPDDDGCYSVEKKSGLDAAGLLSIANDWRKRHGQPPFRLVE